VGRTRGGAGVSADVVNATGVVFTGGGVANSTLLLLLAPNSLFSVAVFDATGVALNAFDSSALDATVVDATVVDATVVDATVVDATVVDATVVDATVVDATALDATGVLVAGILKLINIKKQRLLISKN